MGLSPGSRLGGYEIVAPLGAGGMGEVYRARDAKLGRDVAIKILPDMFAGDADRLGRFEREARAVAALSHPNILAIYDFGSDGGRPYAVMELLDGDSLRDVLASGPLPARKAVDYAGQVASGLAATHDRGIVHRDLKPENVFLTRDGHVKILDFGLAVQTLPGAGDATSAATAAHTSPGAIMGTVGYMAPEQARGQKADHRADIFALGCVLYEMLTGGRAFQRDSAPETLTAILREEPPAMGAMTPPVAPALERVVLHCLEKRPEDRFQSARDLAFALQALSQPSGVSGIQAASTLTTPQASSRRSWTPWLGRIGAAIALVAVGAVGTRVLWPAPSVPANPKVTRLTFDRGTVRSARFAPDGRTVYFGASWGGRPCRIFQTHPGNPESTPLALPDADVLAVSASGEMLISPGRTFPHWVPEGRLSRTAIVGGAVRDLLDGVRTADWASDGQSMLVVRRVDGKDRLEFPMGRVLYETAGFVSDARLSPSGDAVAFMDHPVYGDNRGSVAIVSAPGTMKRLTPEWAGEGGLAWTPDGREIWFTAGNTTDTALLAVDRNGRLRDVWRPPVGIVVHDVAPDGRVLVTRTSVLRTDVEIAEPGARNPRDVSWFSFSRLSGLSPDGRLVLLTRFDEGAGVDYQIGVRPIDASTAVPVGSGTAIQLSPDGRSVLGLVPSDPSKLMVLPVGAGETTTVSAPGFRYSGAAWFPDGTRVLAIAQSGADAEPGIYVQDLQSGAPRRVPTRVQPRANSDLLVSPDGRWAVVHPRGGAPAVVQMADGATRALSGLTADDECAAIGADGSTLYIVRAGSDATPSSAILRYDIGSGRTTVLRDVQPTDPAGVLGRPRCAITPDGRTLAYAVQRYLTDLCLVEGLK